MCLFMHTSHDIVQLFLFKLNTLFQVKSLRKVSSPIDVQPSLKRRHHPDRHSSVNYMNTIHLCVSDEIVVFLNVASHDE